MVAAVTRRFAARRGKLDATQPDIVKALKRVGASVQDLHAVGGGCPDLIVGYRGVNYLLECKTDTGAMKESQDTFIAGWQGAPVRVVRSPAEALTAIGIRLDT